MATTESEGPKEKPYIITEGLPTYKEAVKTSMSERIKTKKWVILGVTATVVVAMVIGGALLGVYLQNKHTRDLIREITINTKDGEEHVRVDPENGEEEYELPDKHFRVLHDFKRGLSIFRMELNNSFACFMKPLNQTNRLPPDALGSYLESGGYHDAEDHGDAPDSGPFGLVSSEKPVTDPSFVGIRAAEMCEDLSYYWLLPAEENIPEGRTQLEQPGHRMKRFICVRICVSAEACWTEYVWIWWVIVKVRVCIKVTVCVTIC